MFKIGDRVKVIEIGQHGVVGYVEKQLYPHYPEGTSVNPYGINIQYKTVCWYKVYKSLDDKWGSYVGFYKEDELKTSIKPLRHKLGFMKKLSLIAQRLLDKDLRTLVKAGILNEELAVEDTDFVLSYFVSEYKEELAKAASKLLKEKKKKCEDDEE